MGVRVNRAGGLLGGLGGQFSNTCELNGSKGRLVRLDGGGSGGNDGSEGIHRLVVSVDGVRSSAIAGNHVAASAADWRNFVGNGQGVNYGSHRAGCGASRETGRVVPGHFGVARGGAGGCGSGLEVVGQDRFATAEGLDPIQRTFHGFRILVVEPSPRLEQGLYPPRTPESVGHDGADGKSPQVFPGVAHWTAFKYNTASPSNGAVKA